MIDSAASLARTLAGHGVAYAPEIARAAQSAGIDPGLLAAVAAQETGGPGANGGRNIVGDGGHGHGLFQIDDRWHSFARSGAAMDPQANADYAAGMLADLLQRYGGDVRKALSAYNAGDPNATGTVTEWPDGQRLSYAGSVMRHYDQLTGATTNANMFAAQTAVQSQAGLSLLPPPQLPQTSYSYRQLAGLDNFGHARQGADPASLLADDDGDDPSLT